MGGSVWGGTGWYLVRRGQYCLIYDGMEQNWLIHDNTGSVEGSAG